MTFLFIANNNTALAGMIFLIQEMKKRYNITPVLVCESCFFETTEFEVINLSPNFHLAPTDDVITEYYHTKEKKIYKQIIKFVRSYRKMGRDERISKKILNEVKPCALLIYCDRMSGILQGFLKNADSIPRIKVPIAVSATEGFGSRYYDSELIVTNRWWDINRIPLIFNQEWAYTYGGETRLFYPMGYIMAGYLRKMISMHPWISGGGKASDVFVATEREKNAILAVSNKNVVVTGTLEDYYILQMVGKRDEVREKLRDKYKLSSNNIIIFSMPQMAEHNLVPWEIHKYNMKVLTRIICKYPNEVLISLHPKSKLDDYKFLSKYPNMHFVDERLKDIISAADVLIAVSSSSVLHWADVVGIKKISIEYEQLLRKIDMREEQEMVKFLECNLTENKLRNFKSDNCKFIRDVVEEIMNIVMH